MNTFKGLFLSLVVGVGTLAAPMFAHANVIVDWYDSKVYMQMDGEPLDNTWIFARENYKHADDEETASVYYYLVQADGSSYPNSARLTNADRPKRHKLIGYQLNGPVTVENIDDYNYVMFNGEQYEWEQPLLRQNQDAVVRTVEITDFAREWDPELRPTERKIDYVVNIDSETGAGEVEEIDNGEVEIQEGGSFPFFEEAALGIEEDEESSQRNLFVILGVTILAFAVIVAGVVLYRSRKHE